MRIDDSNRAADGDRSFQRVAAANPQDCRARLARQRMRTRHHAATSSCLHRRIPVYPCHRARIPLSLWSVKRTIGPIALVINRRIVGIGHDTFTLADEGGYTGPVLGQSGADRRCPGDAETGAGMAGETL